MLHGKQLEEKRKAQEPPQKNVTLDPAEEVTAKIALSRQFDTTLSGTYVIVARRTIPKLDGLETTTVESNTIVVKVNR